MHINLRANIALGLVFAFLVNCLGPMPVHAQDFVLPAPGQMVALSPAFSPAVLKGIQLDAKNPFRFYFFVDRGDGSLSQGDLKSESSKLIKYFLASLTIPEKDLWVNLSPYEKNRIVPQEFGQTEMGRDLLAQDYLLKQITASLIYPESQLGKEFWQKVYAQAQTKYGTTSIPINTFNKVWILPDKAVVYENGGTAFVLENHLKVMLESDYLALQKSGKVGQESTETNEIGKQIVREIVIPALEKEVNEGKNFAQLRQVFYSLILATWYKNKIKDSILNKIYSNRNKIGGVNVPADEKDRIYQEYLKAFKKGVFNYIQEDLLPDGQTVPRKYFSGGLLLKVSMSYEGLRQINAAQVASLDRAQLIKEDVNFGFDQAMNSQEPRRGDKAEAGVQIAEEYKIPNIQVALVEPGFWRGPLPDINEIRSALEGQMKGTELGRRFSRVLASLGLHVLSIRLRHYSISKGGAIHSELDWEKGILGVMASQEDGDILQQLIHTVAASTHDYYRGYHRISDEFFRQGILVKNDGEIIVASPMASSFENLLAEIARRLGFKGTGFEVKALPAQANQPVDSTSQYPPSEEGTLWRLLSPITPGYGSISGWRSFTTPQTASGHRYRYVTSSDPTGMEIGIFKMLANLRTVKELEDLLDLYSISIKTYRQYPSGEVVNHSVGIKYPFFGEEELILDERFFARDLFPDEIKDTLTRLSHLQDEGKLTPDIIQKAAEEIFSRLMAFGEFTERFIYEASERNLLENRKAVGPLKSIIPFSARPLGKRIQWLLKGPLESFEPSPKSTLPVRGSLSQQSLIPVEKKGSPYLTLIHLAKPKSRYEAVGIVEEVLNHWAKERGKTSSVWGLSDRLSSKKVPQFGYGSYPGQDEPPGFRVENDGEFDNGVPYRQYFLTSSMDFEALSTEIDNILPVNLRDSQEWEDLKQEIHTMIAAFKKGLKTNSAKYGHGESMKTGVYVKDSAQAALQSQKGGIDLNPAQMNIQVKNQGEGFKFNFNGQIIDAAQVIGATFTIRTMTPVTDLPLILGLKKEEPEALAKV